MQTLFQDFRYAIRQLRKSPGFAITVMVTLALGIGATTVVYSIVDSVLLKPMPFPQPERLVELASLETLPGGAVRTNDTSYPNFFDWRRENKSFKSIASYKTAGYTLAGAGDNPATRASGMMVSSDFFPTLGVGPVLGRVFRREEEQPGNRSVILSYALWQSQFEGQQDVLGKTVRLNEEEYSVVGVMPQGLVYPLSATDAQFWVTLAHDAEGHGASATQRGYNQLDVVGRLQDGVSLDRARAEMNVVQKGLAARYPDDDKDMVSVDLIPAADVMVGDVRQPLRMLFAAVGFLLLIACVNAAGLLLTRASGRANEIAIRAALGASRSRLLRYLMVEAMTLSLCGGLIGTGLAAVSLTVIPRFLPAGLARAQSIAVNGPVFAFALCISVATGVLFGVVPAWRMSRLAPTIAMNEGRRGATAGRRQHMLHSALVIAEAALSLILLAGAGLLMRSFAGTMHTYPGFDPSHLLTFRVATPEPRYSDERRVVFFNQLLARLKAQPGVESASAAFPLPLTGGDIRISFSIAGQPVAPADEPSERVSVVSPNFFETMRIPLRRGRLFAEGDHTAQAPAVVMINEAFARKYFSGSNPVGQHMRSGLGVDDVTPMREVVGVVGDVKRGKLTESSQPEYYIPIEQAPVAPPAIAMRVTGDPASYENMVRSMVADMDHGLPVYRLRPYAEELARTTAQQRFQTLLLGSFACMALVLAAVGLYALLSYMVVQRTTELGLRIALGAPRGNVLGIILKRGVVLSSIGLLVGLFGSVLLTRFLSGMLFGIKALDVPTFAAVSLVLLLVAALASLAPAYRASRLDPITALRTME